MEGKQLGWGLETPHSLESSEDHKTNLLATWYNLDPILENLPRAPQLRVQRPLKALQPHVPSTAWMQ